MWPHAHSSSLQSPSSIELGVGTRSDMADVSFEARRGAMRAGEAGMQNEHIFAHVVLVRADRANEAPASLALQSRHAMVLAAALAQ